MKPIYKNKHIYIEIEKSEIPWLKVFTKKPYKEISKCDKKTRKALFKTVLKIEKAMIDFYKPDKINIASFGNYLPHVHIHIMARFKNDTHFPEPKWGQKQRNMQIKLPSMRKFIKKLIKIL